jgi:hypothetical protein
VAPNDSSTELPRLIRLKAQAGANYEDSIQARWEFDLAAPASEGLGETGKTHDPPIQRPTAAAIRER